MQKHITRYATEAAYDSDFDNLDFPNVSYIDEGDEVRYMEDNPVLVTGKSRYTAPFTVRVNGIDRTVTLDPNTGDWEISIKPYIPLTSLGNFASSKISIKSIAFPKSFDTSSVTNMAGMFDSCSALTSLPDISGWATSSVTMMRNMFSACSSLTTIEGLCAIGDGTIKVDTYNIFSYNWDQTPKLTTINKAGAIHNTVAFNYCPLTIDSAKVILNALSTPYQGAQTLTFSTTTKGYINADSEALAIVAEKQAMGWTIAL